MPVTPLLRMAIPAPVYRLYDYLPPPGVEPQRLQPGVRLRVPFGRTTRCGLLLEIHGQPEVSIDRLKPAQELLDQEPLVPPRELEFLRWCADYYRHPPGDALSAALPVRLRQGGAALADGQPGWRCSTAGAALDLAQLGRAPRQAQVLGELQSHPAGLAQAELKLRCGECTQILRKLADNGWIEALTLALQSAPAPLGSPAPHPLNPAQQAALDEMGTQLSGFRTFLLDGVTGSGKTEVYLALAQRHLEAGRQVLMLVPEIGLTPQLLQRVERRLGGTIGLLHSGLSDGERERAWLDARSGRARLVLGTRSAVLTPMPELGLIVVDEEHDLSFKQQEGLRYCARDLAVIRAQRLGCPVVLGSATPSLESLRNAALGRYRRLTLPERTGSAGSPRVQLLDIRPVHLTGGLSPALLKAMQQELEAGNQVLLFLNRRGYAPVLTCYTCGWVSECPRCDARTTVHKTDRRVWCHHCGYNRPLPELCPQCGSGELRPLGQGTERLEEFLTSRFGHYGIARIDRDSTRRKGLLEQRLREIREGKLRLLLGTQMLAKGHHFPEVTLAGILNVDQGLFGVDYRASERMAQLIVQVAGRAGRADRPGQVLIQTRYPDHPLLQLLLKKGYGAFATAALAERREARLPPFSYQALLRAEAADSMAPRLFLETARDAAQALSPEGLELWGPVPAPMERRSGRSRAQLLVQSPRRASLQRLLASWIPALAELPQARRVRWSIDVDPQEMY